MPIESTHPDADDMSAIEIESRSVRYFFYPASKRTAQNRLQGHVRKILRSGRPSKRWAWAVRREDGSFYVSPSFFSDNPSWL